MKEKSALSTSGYLDLFPLTTNHVSAFLDSLHVSLYEKLKYMLWEAEIHTVEEEISQLVLCNKKGLDKKLKKKKKKVLKKTTTLLNRILALIHSLKVTFTVHSRATSGLDLVSVLSADSWNLAVRK